MKPNIIASYIEITNKCNLNCITCYNRSGMNTSQQEITFEQLKIIIKQLNAYGCKRFSISGGEPCLHSEFLKILDYIKCTPQYKFDIVTNGTIFNNNLIDLFISSSNLSIQISLDGSCEKINSVIRGKGNFAKSEKLFRALNVTGRKPHVKMVISKLNINDVENFFDYICNNGGIPEFSFINRSGNADNEWENKVITANEKLNILKLINELNIKYSISAILPLCTNECPLDKQDSPLNIAIKTDGTIIPCQLLYSNKFKLSNIFDFNETEFLDNYSHISKMVQIRKETNYGCCKCILKDVCQKGCMAMAEYFSGYPLGTDGECKYRKLQFIGFQLDKIIKERVVLK
ncbi:MAG: hypothetical protein A2Y17_00700 [Clostridiales bacterium GWF2_38_85]|nr:MAG: hypothetical protein A2Y17_00700 [Clostridiales bacterium GWF2_38_85]